jgi:SAM-dependent methyltransferase
VSAIHIVGDDLLSQDAIRAIVRETYERVTPTGGQVAEHYYPHDDIAWLPAETVRLALGVGNPVRRAALRPGENVVDLGSGGGIDCLLAGRAVGPTGSVVGIDFVPDMLDRGRRAAAEAGLANVRFAEGLIEAIPLPDESVDVVISNGVVNLSPRKVRVLSEAFRVLRPGGRLAITDLVLEHDLPPEVLTHPAAWAGCLSGALSEVALYKGLRRSGFAQVSIEPLGPFGLAECALYPLFDDAVLGLLADRVPTERHDRIAMRVFVGARKPAAGERLVGRARE